MKIGTLGIVSAVIMASLPAGIGLAADSGVMTSSTTSVSTESHVKPVQELKWTELKGKVTRVDLQNNVLQIKEDGSDTLLEIPVTSTVAIMKHDHHKYALGDIKEGDKVTLRNTAS
jgi:hypothetical protein